MTEPHPIRVLVLEDHRVVGDGVAAALVAQGGFASAGVVPSVEAVLERSTTDRPDVVVADIDLGDSYAFDLPSSLGPSGPPVVFLSGHDAPSVVRAAVASGAAGFVHKSEPTDALARAIRRVLAGESAFSLHDLALARGGPKAPTARERQVLSGLVGGRANKQIAAELGITERTVESHVRRMLDRYALESRVALAVLALREEWVRMGTAG